jgi:hypothetical protein
MGEEIPPTPCPDCGAKLSLGPQHMNKKMRCPKCGCRFIAGTRRILSPGTRPGAPAKPHGADPAVSTPAGLRKVRCVLCDFQIETAAPPGTPLTCAMCNSVFSEPVNLRASQAEPIAAPAPAPAPASPPPPAPSPVPARPSNPAPPKLDLLEEETPTRTPVMPPPPAAAATPARIAPTEQAPRDVLADQPLAPPSAPVRASMMVLGHPLESIVVCGLSALLGLLGLVGLVLAFAGIDAMGRIMIGPEGDPQIVLPLLTIGAAASLLGLWKREPWGWTASVGIYGIATLLFAVRLGQGAIIPAGGIAAVCLILLIFTRLSGRFD